MIIQFCRDRRAAIFLVLFAAFGFASALLLSFNHSEASRLEIESSPAAAVYPPGPTKMKSIHFPPGVGMAPRSIAVQPETGYIYVANERSNEVSVISGTQVITNLVTTTSPMFVQANPTSGLTYVLSQYSTEIPVFRGTKIITRISLSPYTLWENAMAVTDLHSGYTFVASQLSGFTNVWIISGTEVIIQHQILGNLVDLAVNQQTGEVYLATGSMIYVMQGSLLATSIPLTQVAAITVSQKNDYLYVLQNSGDSPWLLVIEKGQLIGQIKLDCFARDIEANPQSGLVYVLPCENLTIINGTQVVAVLPIPNSVLLRADPTNDRMYVFHENSDYFEPSVITVIKGINVLGTIAVGASARDLAVQPKTGRAYVANYQSNDVSVIQDLAVVNTIPAGVFPNQILYNPVNRYIYAADSMNLYVVTDTQVIASLQLDPWIRGLAVDRNSGLVYVINEQKGNLTIVHDSMVQSVISGIPNPVAVAVSPKTGLVYIANYLDDLVTIVKDGKILAKLPTIHQPNLVKVNPVNGLTFIAGLDNHLTVIQDTQIIATPEGAAVDFAFDSNTGYTYAVSNIVEVLDGATPITKLGSNVSYPSSYISVDYDPVNGLVYAADSNRVRLVMIKGVEIVGTIPLIFFPVSVQVDPGNGRVYVIHDQSPHLWVVQDHQVINRIALEPFPSFTMESFPLPYPRPLAVDPTDGSIYMSDAYHHSIIELSIQPDFNLASTVPLIYVPRGATINQTIALTTQLGYSQPVTITTSGWPSGISAQIVPDPAPPSGTVTLSISVDQNASVGLYTIPITGTSGLLRHSTQIDLIPYETLRFLPWIPENQSSFLPQRR